MDYQGLDELLEDARRMSGVEASIFRSSVGEVLEESMREAEMAVSQPGRGDLEHGDLEALESLATTAIREASALQNFTVYRDLYSIWEDEDELDPFLDSVEAYVRERHSWGEREGPVESRFDAWSWQLNDYDQDYVEEVAVDVFRRAVERLEYGE